MAYLTKTTKKTIVVGDLAGLLLTGFTFPLCMDLFQNYLDHTGDIQTVALLVSRCPYHRYRQTGAEERILNWVEA
jgi:hypothetical protein